MKNILLISFFFFANFSLAAAVHAAPAVKTTSRSNLAFWERTFRYGITAQKESVLDYIRSRRIKEAEDLIVKHVGREKNPNCKKNMMSLLVSFSNQGVIPHLLKIVENEKESALLVFGLMSLGEMKARSHYAAVMKHIDSDDEIVAETALRSLGQMGAVESLERLKEKLRNEKSERVRTGVILALSEMGTDRVQEELAAIFTNEKEKEIDRSYAATGLGRIRNQKSFNLLVSRYDRAAGRIRVRIVESLGQLGDRRAVELLTEALKDDDPNIRYHGVTALGKLKAKECLDILRYKKDYDPDQRVREKVKEILKELEGREDPDEKETESGKK